MGAHAKAVFVLVIALTSAPQSTADVEHTVHARTGSRKAQRLRWPRRDHLDLRQKLDRKVDLQPDVASDLLTCTVVIGDLDDTTNTDSFVKMARQHGCKAHIITKGHSCEKYRGVWNASCEELPNLGRDLGSAVDYVSRHYDALPERVIFTPSSPKHNRHSKAETMLKSLHDPSFVCNKFDDYGHYGFLDQQAQFTLDWKGMTPAQPRGLKSWTIKHIAPFQGSWGGFCGTPMCFNGEWRSTKARIRKQPRQFYQELSKLLNVGVVPEAGHYAERLTGVIFGGDLEACTLGFNDNAVAIFGVALIVAAIGSVSCVFAFVVDTNRKEWSR